MTASGDTCLCIIYKAGFLSLIAIQFICEILKVDDEPVRIFPDPIPHLVASESDEGILQESKKMGH